MREDAFRMKQAQKFTIGLCLAVFISSIQPTALAAVKSGQSCSKLGATSTTKGVKYTCIKLGKKLVWNKGVKVVPVVKPTPTPSPTPEVIPTPTPTVTPTSTPTPTATNLTTEGKALADIKQSLSPISGEEFFRFHYSPNVDKGFVTFLETDLRASIGYWRRYLKSSNLFNVFYGTQDDLNWIIDAWKPYGFDQRGGFAEDLKGRISREGSQLNAGAVPSENGSSHLSILRHTSRSIQFGDYSFITHESIHIVQQSVSGSNTRNFPCWLREGSANLYGAFLAQELHGTSYKEMKRDQMYAFAQGNSGIDITSFSEAQWLQHLRDLEGSAMGACDYPKRFAYGTGLLLSELLVADYGTEAMIDFWSSFKDRTLRESFKAIYKIELDTWYENRAIPYLISEYRRVKR